MCSKWSMEEIYVLKIEASNINLIWKVFPVDPLLILSPLVTVAMPTKLCRHIGSLEHQKSEFIGTFDAADTTSDKSGQK